MANLPENVERCIRASGEEIAMFLLNKARDTNCGLTKDASPIELLIGVELMVLRALKPWLNKSIQVILDDPDGIKFQEPVGKYFADFVFQYDGRKVAVELDGHQFHDRDESQRRYEKQRDRFFQAQGYQVLHFTGKEITDNAMAAIEEVFNHLDILKTKSAANG